MHLVDYRSHCHFDPFVILRWKAAFRRRVGKYNTESLLQWASWFTAVLLQTNWKAFFLEGERGTVVHPALGSAMLHRATFSTLRLRRYVWFKWVIRIVTQAIKTVITQRSRAVTHCSDGAQNWPQNSCLSRHTLRQFTYIEFLAATSSYCENGPMTSGNPQIWTREQF